MNFTNGIWRFLLSVKWFYLYPDTPKSIKMNFYERHLTLPTIGKMVLFAPRVHTIVSGRMISPAFCHYRKLPPSTVNRLVFVCGGTKYSTKRLLSLVKHLKLLAVRPVSAFRHTVMLSFTNQFVGGRIAEGSAIGLLWNDCPPKSK